MQVIIILQSATDVHNAVNNILAAKGFTTENGMDAEGNAELTFQWTNDTFIVSVNENTGDSAGNVPSQSLRER